MINNYPDFEDGQDMQGNINLQNSDRFQAQGYQDNQGNQSNAKNNQGNEVIMTNKDTTIIEKVSGTTVSFISDHLAFIKGYFDVDFADVLSRLKAAVIPFSKSFQVNKDNPDLYGPFWIYTTIIFLINVAGNISGYFNLEKGKTFSNNYNFIPYAALFMYSIGFGVPIAVYFLSKFVFKASIEIVFVICLYGYSFVILIPILFLCMIPVNFLETILLIYFVAHSGLFLVYNMWGKIEGDANKVKYPIMGILIGIQVLLFFGLKFYFFAEANVTRKVTS